ncbi:hypothetical protein OG436_39525 (plasmid) [Streptomyces caniferus]|uniref:hypothetical protein n=1 Tax=Streptomyces caniferus TaxID=285557 RepID=UPI002E2E55FA|nr:hypothetical protein [Streptomyces caniferus]
MELPGTIAAVRATMDADQAVEFDRDIEHVPAAEFPVVLVRWALAVTGAEEEDDALFESLARGEDIGVDTRLGDGVSHYRVHTIDSRRTRRRRIPAAPKGIRPGTRRGVPSLGAR